MWIGLYLYLFYLLICAGLAKLAHLSTIYFRDPVLKISAMQSKGAQISSELNATFRLMMFDEQIVEHKIRQMLVDEYRGERFSSQASF